MLNIPELDLAVYDIIAGKNLEHLEDFLLVYGEYLPQYLRYEPLMRQRAQQPQDPLGLYYWHQWLVRLGGKPAAMVTFVLNRRRNLGILLDFAVAPEARAIQYQGHTRLAGLILELSWEQLRCDALADGLPAPACMIAEVEHVPLVERYKQYGFVELPVEYYEPPFTPGLAEIVDPSELQKFGYRRLYLGAFAIPGGGFDPDDSSMMCQIIETLLFDHYQMQPEHWTVRMALQCFMDEMPELRYNLDEKIGG